MQYQQDLNKLHLFPRADKKHNSPTPTTQTRIVGTTYINGQPVYETPLDRGAYAVPKTYPPIGGFKLPPNPATLNSMMALPPNCQLIYDPITQSYKVLQSKASTSSYPMPPTPPAIVPQPTYYQNPPPPPMSQQFPPYQFPTTYIPNKQPPMAPIDIQNQQFFELQQQEQEFKQFSMQQPPIPPPSNPIPMNEPIFNPNLAPPIPPSRISPEYQSKHQEAMNSQQPIPPVSQQPIPPMNVGGVSPLPPPTQSQQPVNIKNNTTNSIKTQDQIKTNGSPLTKQYSESHITQQPSNIGLNKFKYPVKSSESTQSPLVSKEFPSTKMDTNLKKEDKERLENRKKRLNELITTEESYSDSLENLILYFKIPLEQDLQRLNLTDRDISIIFSNIEAILVVSKDLLLKLKYRFSLPPEQQLIGDLYIEKSHEMKLYCEYINNYEKSMNEVQKIEMIDPNFFKNCQSKYKSNLDIRSYLIMPVQRVPRYELLLRDVLKYTSIENPDYKNLEVAHQSIKEINEYINSHKKLRENQDRVVTISQELRGIPERLNYLLSSSRRFVREGLLDITCTHKKYSGTFMVYLFNDLIILAKQPRVRKSKGFEFHADIDLKNSEFKDLTNSDTEFRFISDSQGKSPYIFTFTAPNNQEKMNWINDLRLLEEERKLSIVNKFNLNLN
ncbi:pleckstrin (PH) domain-containing protein [Tieghemostelium lacteum]|uniref:Pleckstrin (PH) domain-containing protein n=1 Tax=Tieghemostelium lacteum TaxID=361077 RepID=A0A151ZKQ5_TIELA|nr:pleckstrin (PH) domain-containing protein [Tieghemostelium lacteum]|eukprot:KYQ94374.1 pleckstrin (PH) domain-containing protein [Tieghemostelium lacteum]